MSKQSQSENLIELLSQRNEAMGDNIVYTFLPDKGDEKLSLSYQQLYQRVCAKAAFLQQQEVEPGDRVILLYHPGDELLAAFWACAFVGAVAVPMSPPVNKRLLDKLQAVIADCNPRLILTTSDVVSKIQRIAALKFADDDDLSPELAKLVHAEQSDTLSEVNAGQLKWLITDHLQLDLAAQWQPVQMRGDKPVFLQYTSGSTGDPKGVIISHDNLLRNFALIKQGFPPKPHGGFVSWLPPYHDMGLIGTMLYPIYLGLSSTLMSPLAFLRNPLRWLQVISQTPACITSAPNFAYALCVEKVKPEHKQQLDLSDWDIATCGAEPINAEVMAAFCATFADCGFQPQTLYACYGLAEATLAVSARQQIVSNQFVKSALAEQKVIKAEQADSDACELVSSGAALQTVRIVDPQTHRCLPDDMIGEVWVRDSSVGQGYWNQAELTEQTFQAQADDGQRYLRTGDLGFINLSELYIAGRIKDLIIIRGTNHYPQDIEYSVQKRVSDVRPGSVVAFSDTAQQTEQLNIVAELKQKNAADDYTAVFNQIVATVADEHQLAVAKVVLVARNSVPRTTSGKVQRRETKRRLAQGELSIIEQFEQQLMADQQTALEVEEIGDIVKPNGKADVRQLLHDHLKDILSMPASNVLDEEADFGQLGLDSLMAVELENRLSDDLPEFNASQIDLWQYPNLKSLIVALESQQTQG
jgi:acyl-CoA synthetase (AMP-forming)/AMP-acid ligase II/acyl carrier protein